MDDSDVDFAEQKSSVRYMYPEVVDEYFSAWRRIRSTPSPRSLVFAKGERGARKALLVLAAAQEIYQPGDTASALILAGKVGISRQTAQNAIAALRRKQMWPYAGGQKGSSHRYPVRITYGCRPSRP